MFKAVCSAPWSQRFSSLKWPVLSLRNKFLIFEFRVDLAFFSQESFNTKQPTNLSKTLPQLSQLTAEWRGISLSVQSISSRRDWNCRCVREDRLTIKLTIFTTVAITSLRSELEIFIGVLCSVISLWGDQLFPWLIWDILSVFRPWQELHLSSLQKKLRCQNAHWTSGGTTSCVSHWF